MRDYVETLELLERTMPEGRNATPEEVLAAMADDQAARIDAARDALKYGDAP